MKYLLATFLLISGCASFDAQRISLEVTKAVVTVVPNVKFKSPKQRGKTFWYDVDGVRYCTIMLDAYPAYIGHEAVHCFSGQWHGNEVNGEDYD